MYPVILKFGPIIIYSWGLMVAMAVLSAIFITIHFAKQEKIRPETVFDLFGYLIIFSVIGARLSYVLSFPDQFLKNPISILFVQEGGLAFFGGFLFAVGCVFYYARIKKLDLFKLLDVLSPGTAIGYSIGRIGCYLNGCCYGISIFGIQHPTQVYSSISGLMVFFLALTIYRKKKYDGQVFWSSLCLYTLLRSVIEFFRFSPIHLLIVTPSQAISAIVFVITSYILWKKRTT